MEKTIMANLEDIENNTVYQQVLKDSYGGIMYNVDNFDKYDSTELLALWDSLTPAVKESADGIIKGAIDFLQHKGF